jgi:hypothetical protein
MKLQKIVSRLQELHPKEIDLSLDRIQNLCQGLGNPQDKLKADFNCRNQWKVFNYPSDVCYFKRSKYQM